MAARIKTTFNLAKLAKRLNLNVTVGLNHMIKELNNEIQRNTESGVDVKGNKFKSLSQSTGTQRINKEGYYKQKGGGGILNYTGNMKRTKVTQAKPTAVPTARIEMTGKLKKGKNKGEHYGAFHNTGGGKLPKRKWFGI